MNIEEAIKVLTHELVNDEEYRRSWSANIAMSFYDVVKLNNNYAIDREWLHKHANMGAELFLEILCRKETQEDLPGSFALVNLVNEVSKR